MMGLSDAQARERVQRLEGLLGALEQLPAPARETALDAVGALVEIYGEVLRRMLAQASGEPARRQLAADELVSHLLMVHDLHPASLAERVEGALEQVRPYLASHGGGVELVEVDGSTVRLALRGHCDGCAASMATLQGAVEEAVLSAAPEIERVEASGAVDPPVGGTALPMAELHEAPGPCLPMVGEAR